MINETLSANIQLDESSDLDLKNAYLEKSISQAQLSRVVDNLPHGVLTNIGENGVRLSGGQRQRVALARAIFHSRDILVFDEATSALDSDTESEVVNEIRSMKGIKTMIVIAHRTETLRFCDRIYKIHNGVIDEIGTPDEILGSLKVK
jgi:ABC-type bacteriocin/lantibiotic exporter with double-glycine peptidase domain